MAAFKQDFSIVQSSDCTTLTFTDTSNFSDNDEGYTYEYFTTKSIQVLDSDNNPMGDPIPVVDDTPVTFELDKDRWLSIVYVLQHNADSPLFKTYDVALSCNVDVKLGTIVAATICKCDEADESVFNIIKTTLASKIYAQRNNPVLSQEMLDMANEYANCGITGLDSNCNCN